MIAELYWDPFDTQIDTDPYDIWRRLRDEAPLYRNERYDFYALSRFADVEAAHREPHTFSSAHGTVLELMRDEPIGGGQMIFLDPPEHTRLRSLVSRAFTPRRMSELEDRIRDLCRDFLDDAGARGTFDYVQDFGARLPAMVIASLLGVPLEDQNEVRGYIDQVFHIEPGVGMINDVSFAAMLELHGYISAQLEQRAAHPVDDMLTDLVQAEITVDGVTASAHPGGERQLRHPVDQRGHRDGGPVAGLDGGGARQPSRSAGRAGRRSHPHPQRGRGAAALRGPVAGAGPLDHRRGGGAAAGSSRPSRRCCC